MRYHPTDQRLADLPGRINYLRVMTDDADAISAALVYHMRNSSDAQRHGLLHRLCAVMRSFVEGMTIELAKYDAHIKKGRT
jgi:sulfate adenylyltransferase subunit 1 (EFTu-like GTPase family)